MEIGEIMSRRVGLIDQATTIAAAARQMRDDDLGCLLVGRRDRVLGIVTGRDIVVRTLAGGLHAMGEPVRYVMSSEVLCCFADQPVEEATRIMAAHGIRRLPAPCCTDRTRWRRGVTPSTILGSPSAVQGQCRSPSSHPRAAAPGDELARV